MKIENLERRVERLRPNHLILEIEINGKLERLTAQQFVEGGFDFLSAQIIAGNSLSDAALLLSLFPSPGIR